MSSEAVNGVLVTVPVHNEEAYIAHTVASVRRTLDEAAIDYRLAIVEDGSTDGTKSLLAEAQEKFPDLLVQTDTVKRGRGWAIRRLWSRVSAPSYAFLDADLSATPSSLVRLLSRLRDGADIVVGSRYSPEARVIRPPVRKFVSLTYNWLVRSVFHDGIYDHQCGLKAFTSEAVARVLPLCSEDSWFWDTEVLVIARSMGMNVAELPIEWRETRNRRTPFSRLVSDVVLHGSGVLRLVGELPNRIERGPSPTVIARGSSALASTWNR